MALLDVGHQNRNRFSLVIMFAYVHLTRMIVMKLHRRQAPLESTLIVGAPLLLAIVEAFHPQPHDLLHLDLHRWLAVHYAQISLFPLSALGRAWLIRGQTGIAAMISRVALFVFGTGGVPGTQWPVWRRAFW